ncbi:MAG TPA: tripartite tricarboxylate transporter permease [Candidatus Methylomirabilis sp.]|nr:tripartite tricarboxylate transporter permease [Candidatus Methylomirabilis sp.]
MFDFAGLLLGFQVAFNPVNLLWCFIGSVLGTAVGVLPGLGPAATIALLLPISMKMGSPVTAIILMAGIFYGAMYGGSTTSILLNLPGEAASVVTCIDGYQMARKGRAGPALGVAAIASFIAGTFGVVGMTVMAPPLAEFALKFGPPEYFALTVLGLLLATYLTGDSPLKGLTMAIFGLILGSVGLDPLSGAVRFDFGVPDLQSNIDFVTVAMGLFGVGEILINLEQAEAASILTTKIKNVFPTMADLARSGWAMVRGSFIGFGVGILPGGGAVLSSLISYAVEKKCSRHPEEFGQGAIEGVAGPEAANNSAASSSFIPLLTLGIPGNASTAMIFAALLIHGITPGPFLLKEHASVFWGVIASMYIGNIMLLILNLPLVGMWAQLLKVPYAYMAPMVMVLTLVGVYSVNNSVFDIWVMLVMGVFGYFARKLRFDLGPLLLAFVLGPIMERSLRQALLMSHGSFGIFFWRPISGALMVVAMLFVVGNFLVAHRKARTA